MGQWDPGWETPGVWLSEVREASWGETGFGLADWVEEGGAGVEVEGGCAYVYG
jgi:hypothetical protein